MDTREKIKLRQMIWVEYQAETDIEQAVINVRKKLPSYNVSESIVDYWYKSFNPYENHFLEPDNEEYDILLVVRTLSNGVEVIIFTIYKYNLFRTSLMTRFYSFMITIPKFLRLLLPTDALRLFYIILPQLL
jgi:hypothetical protein